jgi:hypothetical protein
MQRHVQTIEGLHRVIPVIECVREGRELFCIDLISRVRPK